MKRWFVALMILTIGLCSIAGCTGQSPAAQGNASPPAAPSITTRPIAGSVEAVDYAVLIDLLPDAPLGWSADEAMGMGTDDTGESYSFAERTYWSGDVKRAVVVIVDSAYYNVGGWELWQDHYDIASNEGYWQSGRIEGYPSWEWFDRESSTYTTWVGINERFMVSVTVEEGTKADLDLFAAAIDCRRIAALR